MKQEERKINETKEIFKIIMTDDGKIKVWKNNIELKFIDRVEFVADIGGVPRLTVRYIVSSL